MAKYTEIEAFEQKCYEAYQLHWMITHGYSLRNAYRIILNYAARTIEDEPLSIPTDGNSLANLMDSAKEEMIFGDGFECGYMFASKEDFLVEEFLDEDYMNTLLSMMPYPAKMKELYKAVTAGEEEVL